jgi:AcrR family transcriptional regulator
MIPPVSTSVQRSRRREQREQTRREILAAADRLLRERPYRDLSVDLVMAQTGLTRTAFYRHFDDVPDLVLRLLGDVGHELFAVAEHWRELEPTRTAESGREALAATVGFWVRHGRLIRAVHDAAATDAVIEEGYRGFLDEFTDLIAGRLQELVDRGWLVVPDVRALALALNLMNEAFLLEQFGHESPGDPEVALATLETVWLRVITGSQT